jgi:hypothetical protein
MRLAHETFKESAELIVVQPLMYQYVYHLEHIDNITDLNTLSASGSKHDMHLDFTVFISLPPQDPSSPQPLLGHH